MKYLTCIKQYVLTTWIALEFYNNNDKQINRHDFLREFRLII